MVAYGDSNDNSLVNNNSFIEVDNEVYIDDKIHKFYFGGVKYKKIKIKKSKLKDFLIWYSLVSIVITSLIFQYYLLILLFPITYYLIKSSIKLYKKKTDIIDYSNKSYFNLINPNFMNLHILPVIPIYDIIDDAYKNIIFKISFYLILLSLPLLILYIIIPEINFI
jgi:hypothetical protein